MAETTSIWKYCYWLDEPRLETLKRQMQEKGVEMNEAKQNPCEAMKTEIGYSAPETWPAICRHDATPWYDASRFSGKYLVVSSSRLDDGYDRFLETTITPVSFDPPAMPSRQERESLVQDGTYVSRRPPVWDSFPEEMGERIAKGLGDMSGRPAETWKDLFTTWTAVHSNFVNPRYRAGDQFLNAPYSIADSYTISSCCVELFNLLDSKEKALLVRPCIGGVIVKALEIDQYYLVRLVKNEV